MTPKVSVIIPAYRCESTIESAVRSALAQTERELEVIVVDDASDDGTAEILKRLSNMDARVRVVTLPQNGGVSNARNTGVRCARADRIAFLDGDDVWMPDKIERQLKTAEDAGAGLVYTGAACIDEEGVLTGRIFKVPPEVSYGSQLYGNDLICSSVMVDRTLIAAHPMRDRRLHEDYLCWLEILKENVRTAGIQEPLVRYRVYRGSRSANKFRAAGYMWKTYRDLGFGFFMRIRYFSGYCLHGLKRHFL